MLAVVLAAFVLLALSSEHDSAMACDDAYISFRFAENLQNGHGLRWNPDMEPCEGYTNLLQILLLCALHSLGIPHSTGALWIALLSVAGIVAILVGFAKPSRWYFPLSASPAVVFLLDTHVEVHATRGLETLLFAFLATAMTACLAALVQRQGRCPRMAGFAALSSILLFLCRPDGVLLLGMAWCTTLLVLGLRSHGVRVALAGFLSVLVAGLGYAVWKFSYFGYLLPNPFYMKGAVSGFKGVRETREFLIEYWPAFFVFVTLICLIALSLRLRRRAKAGTEDGFRTVPSTPLLAAAMAAPWLLYTAKILHEIGFNHRFAFPIFPVVLLGTTVGLSAVLSLIPSFRGRAALGWLALAVVLVTTRVELRAAMVGLSGPRPNGDAFTSTFRRLGQILLDTELADQITLICSHSGATPYVAKCRHIDPGGLTDNMMCKRTPPSDRDLYWASLRWDVRTSPFLPASEGAISFDQDPLMSSAYVLQFHLKVPAGHDLSRLTAQQGTALDERMSRIFGKMQELRDTSTLVGEMRNGLRKARHFVYVSKESEIHDELVDRLRSAVDIPPEEINWNDWPP